MNKIKLSKDDPLYFSKMSKMRKNKVGGQAFKKDPDLARTAGAKGGKISRRRKLEDKVMDTYLEEADVNKKMQQG